jgi:hypothetical protein
LSPPAFASSSTAVYRAFLGEEMKKQRVDADWSGRAETAIKSTLLQFTDPHSKLEALQCRSTLCEARFAHDDERAYRAFLDRAVHVGVWPGAMFFTTATDGEGNGPITALAYFGKEGAELPDRELTANE